MNDDSGQESVVETSIGQSLTYRMARVQAKLNAQSTRLLKEDTGLSLTQWRLLALIGTIGQTTAAQLSRHAAMDKGLISRNLRAMSDGNLIQVTPDDRDHRLQHLDLTEAGKALFDLTLPRMLARQAALRARLTDEDLRTFLATLDTLEQAAEDPDLG